MLPSLKTQLRVSENYSLVQQTRIQDTAVNNFSTNYCHKDGPYCISRSLLHSKRKRFGVSTPSSKMLDVSDENCVGALRITSVAGDDLSGTLHATASKYRTRAGDISVKRSFLIHPSTERALETSAWKGLLIHEETHNSLSVVDFSVAKDQNQQGSRKMEAWHGGKFISVSYQKFFFSVMLISRWVPKIHRAVAFCTHKHPCQRPVALASACVRVFRLSFSEQMSFTGGIWRFKWKRGEQENVRRFEATGAFVRKSKFRNRLCSFSITSNYKAFVNLEYTVDQRLFPMFFSIHPLRSNWDFLTQFPTKRRPFLIAREVHFCCGPTTDILSTSPMGPVCGPEPASCVISISQSHVTFFFQTKKVFSTAILGRSELSWTSLNREVPNATNALITRYSHIDRVMWRGINGYPTFGTALAEPNQQFSDRNTQDLSQFAWTHCTLRREILQFWSSPIWRRSKAKSENWKDLTLTRDLLPAPPFARRLVAPRPSPFALTTQMPRLPAKYSVKKLLVPNEIYFTDMTQNQRHQTDTTTYKKLFLSRLTMRPFFPIGKIADGIWMWISRNFFWFYLLFRFS